MNCLNDEQLPLTTRLPTGRLKIKNSNMTTIKWVIDPTHSEIGFKIRHLMITNVSGNFNQFEIVAETEGEDFTTAKIEASIKTSSINTNNLQRDEHLRNSDFFEVESHPEIHFTSTKLERLDDGNFRLHGDLSLKGITRPVTFQVEYNGIAKDPWGGYRAGFFLNGKINRSDFGLTFNSLLDSGGVALAEEVKIHSEVQLVKQLEVAVA
jgi:polyisoprenoid-binding protein YceI